MQKIATVLPKDFRLAYGKISAIKTTNTVLSINENVLVKTFPKGLILTSTNLQTFGITSTKAKVEDPKASFLMPLQAVKLLCDLDAEKEVEIWTDGADQLRMTGPNNLEVNFKTDNLADYPRLPEVEAKLKFTLPTFEELKEKLQLAAPFTSRDDLRANMTGVYFSHTSICATDAHRLALAEFKTQTDAFEVILPRELIIAIDAFDGKNEINIVSDHKYISFNDKSTKIIATLVAGKFPDYKTVLPKDYSSSYELNKSEFCRFLKLAMAVADQKTNGIVLDFKPEEKAYTMKSGDVDYQTSLNLQGELKNLQENTPTEVSLNAQFVLAVINRLRGEAITMRLHRNQVVFTDGDRMYLIMALAKL